MLLYQGMKKLLYEYIKLLIFPLSVLCVRGYCIQVKEYHRAYVEKKGLFLWCGHGWSLSPQVGDQ